MNLRGPHAAGLQDSKLRYALNVKVICTQACQGSFLLPLHYQSTTTILCTYKSGIIISNHSSYAYLTNTQPSSFVAMARGYPRKTGFPHQERSRGYLNVLLTTPHSPSPPSQPQNASKVLRKSHHITLTRYMLFAKSFFTKAIRGGFFFFGITRVIGQKTIQKKPARSILCPALSPTFTTTRTNPIRPSKPP